MGGSIFASGPEPLFTPRMPPEVYHHVKARCHRALRDLYVCVASPIDGPAKKSFGDVDILVTWSREEIFGLSPEFRRAVSDGPNPRRALEEIMEVLGATKMIREKNDQVAHYAIPWPEEFQDVGREEDTPPRYIQVDVAISPSLQSFEWVLFKQAHGDLWNILGSMIRYCGLSIDETALSIRIPEVEEISRNMAKVKISDDPLVVLSVLGLKADGYWEEPFDSSDDLYEYAATSPFFWIRPIPPETADKLVDDPSVSSPAAQQAIAEDRKALKANDRRRMNTRPCYRGWIEDFIPRCRAEGRFFTKRCTRESVRTEIFSKFPIEAEYNQKRKDHLIRRQREVIWNKHIKGYLQGLPTYEELNPTYRGCMLKGLKRIILEDDRSYGIVPDKAFRDDEGYYLMDRVDEYVQTQHEAVGDAAMARNNAKYEKILEEKKRKQEHGEPTASADEEVGE
ncbi:hypothetical protein jhhlp_006769 [Lomentospora prolificans]|uniref:Uncharacterized protein n=1 Tax=Lomentospora prolificans TaxID=41688 RepID=A0A2N3N2M9_9PEZI|nr:hypothetical protein jhhlp_006769 [Lomentospora prolificans]